MIRKHPRGSNYFSTHITLHYQGMGTTTCFGIDGKGETSAQRVYMEIAWIFVGLSMNKILLLLIQRPFGNSIYPGQWTTNYLKPIQKEGSVFDPGNYRSLAIGLALAKLFSHIMLMRLDTFNETKNCYLVTKWDLWMVVVLPITFSNYRLSQKKLSRKTRSTYTLLSLTLRRLKIKRTAKFY